MTPAEAAKLTVPKLKAELTDRGLETSGLKAVLLARLLAALAEPAVSSASAAHDTCQEVARARWLPPRAEGSRQSCSRSTTPDSATTSRPRGVRLRMVAKAALPPC